MIVFIKDNQPYLDIFFEGADDKVVPHNKTELMAERVKKQGRSVSGSDTDGSGMFSAAHSSSN